MPSAETIQAHSLSQLPDTAPSVRLTAGTGTAGQKTWNLRRPVTLIGTRRPAHIVVHDSDTSDFHCVIVNTGSDVLLRDLHTESGTYCNGTKVHSVHLLKDGDEIRIGATRIQIGIEIHASSQDESQTSTKRRDPTKWSRPLSVLLDDTGSTWRIEETVSLIGRHPLAAIHLDHENVCPRHAVLFQYLGVPAVFDAGSRTGVWVNGERCAASLITPTDRVLIGPFALVFSPPRKGAQVANPRVKAPASPSTVTDSPAWSAVGHETDDGGAVPHSPFAILQRTSQEKRESGTAVRAEDNGTSASSPPIKAWECLPAVSTTSRTHVRTSASRSRPRLGMILQALDHREEELQRREADLHRRELILANHLARQRAMRCPDCGHPILNPETIAADFTSTTDSRPAHRIPDALHH